MVAARQLEPAPNDLAEDLRKHVIRLLQADGEETRGNILVLPQVFLEFLDYDHKMALFLNKLLYWTERTKNPDKWVYKTYRDWFNELGFKESVIRRLLYGDPSTKTRKRTLTDIGVEVRVKRAPNGSPTCHYRINLEVFLEAIRHFGDERRREESRPDQGKFPVTNPPNPQDRTFGSPDLDSTGSAATSDQVTTTQNPTEVTSAESSSGATRDDDLQTFISYQKRFGKVKEVHQQSLRAELARLGAGRVGQVLERCATRGRSWNYVLKALANEAGAATEPQARTTWPDFVLTGRDGERQPFCEPQQAAPALQASERVKTPWNGFGGAAATVLDAWNAAFHQLECQFDRGSFETWLCGATLVDFEPETRTFVVVARNAQAAKMLAGRLDRTVKRIVGDVYGQPVEVRYLLKDEWLGQGASGAQIA